MKIQKQVSRYCATLSLLMGSLFFITGCGNAESNAVKATEIIAEENGFKLTKTLLNNYISVGETIRDAELSQEEQASIKKQLIESFKNQPEQVVAKLQPFTSMADQLTKEAEQNERADLIEQLFTNFTHGTVIELLAPQGAITAPTNPTELVKLAEARLGDFSEVIIDLMEQGDIRGFIFAKRLPQNEEIENAIVSLHDLALTNQLASNSHIGAAFQSAVWSGQ